MVVLCCKKLMRTQILAFLCCFAHFLRHISCDSCHAAINQIYINVTEECACTKILLLMPFNRKTLAVAHAAAAKRSSIATYRRASPGFYLECFMRFYLSTIPESRSSISASAWYIWKQCNSYSLKLWIHVIWFPLQISKQLCPNWMLKPVKCCFLVLIC